MLLVPAMAGKHQTEGAGESPRGKEEASQSVKRETGGFIRPIIGTIPTSSQTASLPVYALGCKDYRHVQPGELLHVSGRVRNTSSQNSYRRSHVGGYVPASDTTSGERSSGSFAPPTNQVRQHGRCGADT